MDLKEWICIARDPNYDMLYSEGLAMPIKGFESGISMMSLGDNDQ